MNLRYQILIIIIFFALTFMSGCSQATEDKPIIVATHTATTTPTPTSIPTWPPTISPTMTLVPALSKEGAEARVIELLSNNGGCRLPCFWGFIPGESSKQEYISFKHAFSKIAPISGPGMVVPLGESTVMGIFTVFSRYDETQSYTDIQNSDIVRRISVYMWAFQLGEFGEHVYTSTLFSQYAQKYSLAYLLADYGAPSAIFVRIEQGMGSQRLLLFLDYSEPHWSAMSWMQFTSDDIDYIGCPDQSLINLWLWAPEDTESATEYGGYLPELHYFTSLEKATSLTIDEFYNMFKNPENTMCIGTPIELWQEP